MVLLHDQYSTGDDYTDSQFRDFFHAISTMSVFLTDQTNFVEVVEPALNVSGLYVVLFAAISGFSMFFVSAILLTLFMDTYSTGAGGTVTPMQRRKWAALTLTHLLCMRSLFKPKRRKQKRWVVCELMQTEEMDCEPSVFHLDGEDNWHELYEMHPVDSTADNDEPDMTPLMFEHLMLQCYLFSDMADSWIGSARMLILESICLLHEQKGKAATKYRHEAATLATICSKLQLEKEYEEVIRELFPPFGIGSGDIYHKGCFEANQEAILTTALVQTGLCSNELDEQIDFVRLVLGPMEQKEALTQLLNTSVPLLSIGDSDSEDDVRSILHAALKVDVSQREQPDIITPTGSWFEPGGNRYFQTVVERCVMLQHVHEMYRIEAKSSDPLTQNVSALVTLVHMHIWKCRLLFDGLDANQDGGLQLVEFEKLWCFTSVSARLASSRLLQKEAEVMLLGQEIDVLSQDLQGVLARTMTKLD